MRPNPLPRTGADVPDDYDARLVVLPAEQPYSREAGNAAEVAAKAILESRGNTPRLYRNTLVFLAADKVRLTQNAWVETEHRGTGPYVGVVEFG